MNSSIQKMAEVVVRCEIVSQLWSRQPSVQLDFDDLDWQAYFSYYLDQCRSLKQTTAKVHEDVVEISQFLEQLPSKDAIKDALAPKLCGPRDSKENEQVLEETIILGTRLTIMMSIGNPRKAFSGRPALIWSDGNLRSFVHHYFNESPVLSSDNIKFEPIFNAQNLVRVAGFKIEWTSNLADHLRMMDEKTVAIFHHASFLRWQQRFVPLFHFQALAN
jgi:hypothetical protein